MENTFSNVTDTIKAIFDFDITRRLFFFAGIAASIVIGVSLYQWIQDPIYHPLPYSVNDQNFSSIVSTLEKEHIPYRLNERNGTISVPSSDMNRAKYKLSSAGIQKDDGFSFSFLNEQNKLGTSSFLENARYLRALEADLAKTIRAIQGINNAKVNLAIPQHNIFADENSKPKASIVVNISPGYDNDKEKIRAIIQLVSASVPELDPSNVAITDQYGHYLSSIINKSSILNQEQLSYQNNIQHYYENKIKALITPIIGENKASISVHANLDFTQKEQAKEAYDPEKKTTRSEQQITQSNGSPAGASGVPGAASNQSNKPSATGQDAGQGAGQGAQQSRTESVKNYEVSKTIAYVKNSAPLMKSISAAVILDDDAVYDEKSKQVIGKPLTKERIEKITELVKSTIGFEEKRGDRVTVINSTFKPRKIETIPYLPLWQQPWFWEWAKRTGGVIVGFIFLFILYRKLSSEMKVKTSKVLTEASPYDPNNAIIVTPEMIQLKNEQIAILKELASKDPNKVANIIKKWVAK